MKKFGIIGGAGPLASALFYETLVHESYRQERPLPEIFLLNYPFQRALTLRERKGSGRIVREQLRYCLSQLEKNGACAAALICNTLHLELSHLTTGKLQLIRIPDLVLAKVLEEKREKPLLLLATQNTCTSTLYRHPKVTIFSPHAEGQRVVDETIDHVLQGRIRRKDSEALKELIEHFSPKSGGVILGCTDLSVLHHHFPLRSKIPLYDSVTISAKGIGRFL